MKTPQWHENISSLREEIAVLSVVKCRMSHERVVRAADTMLPVMCRFPEGSYQRIGLCSTEIRERRIGCSHTTARIKLERAINELEKHGKSIGKSGESLGDELNRLNNEIHLLDHRKGEAEKAFARILWEIHNASDQAAEFETLKQAEEDIREMENLHDGYVEKIGILKDRILAELDKLIEQADMNYICNADVSEVGV